MKMILKMHYPEESSHWNTEIKPFLQAHLATWLEGDSELATMVRAGCFTAFAVVWNWKRQELRFKMIDRWDSIRYII